MARAPVARAAAVAALYAIVLVAWALRSRFGSHNRLAFHCLFALTVTASVQLVGVLLVFASLIAPAVATHGAGGRRRIAAAWLAGALAYAAGLGLSLYADLPAGAAVTCCMCLIALAGLCLSRPHGRRLY